MPSPESQPSHLQDLEPGCASLAQARADTRQRCRHYENFSLMSWFMPMRLRPALRTIYAFARYSDDLADEALAGSHEGAMERELRRERLLHWAGLLRGLPATANRHPILCALAEDARMHGLPLEECGRLLEAFLQDQEPPDFPDDASVLAYCRNSAAPVGRLLLALNGLNARHPRWHELTAWSDEVCAGLQLANFWQDLSRDLPAGRLYIPRQRLAQHGLVAGPAAVARAGDAFEPLLRQLSAWARELLSAAEELAARLPWRFALELRMFAGGGLAILMRTEALGGGILTRRPVLSGADKARVALRAARPSWASGRHAPS